MNPMWGAAAMSISSFTVCMNALRLNLFKVHDAKHDRKLRHPAKPDTDISDENVIRSNDNIITEGKQMTKTLKVEGMMCMHCEARVKKALEAIAGVESAVADHEAGTAVVTLNAEVADNVLRKAVEDQDYKVLGVE